MNIKKVILCVLVLIIVVAYLSIFGINMVSTDKKTYSYGENITISYFGLRLSWCTCDDRRVSFYQKRDGEWKGIFSGIFGFQPVCINGKIGSGTLGMPCDVIICSLIPKPRFDSGNFVWDGKFYEYLGWTTECEGIDEFNLARGGIQNYEFKTAPPGLYKIKFGTAEKIIEIK